MKKRFYHSAVLLYFKKEENLSLADNLFSGGPSDENMEEFQWTLASWSALLNSARAQHVLKNTPIKWTASGLASRIRGLNMWWFYPVLFILDVVFLIQLGIKKRSMSVGDLMLSSVKYRTGLFLFARFLKTEFLVKDKSFADETTVYMFYVLRGALDKRL